MTHAVPVLLADTVTRLDERHAGAVLVTGSHGGLIAARYVADAGVRAVVFNDAGIGCDEAGVAGVAWLGVRGVAAAAVAHDSARIADATDSLAHGRISRCNGPAAACGVAIGDACREAAEKLRQAPLRRVAADDEASAQGRWVLAPGGDGEACVVGLDSIGLVVPDDAGRVLVIGSHGGLHGGDPASALPVAARAAFFHDAGVGKDGAGATRLPVLAARNLPAATIDYRSARIGDARSMWATGVLSRVNVPMRERGVAAGARVQDAAARLLRAGA